MGVWVGGGACVGVAGGVGVEVGVGIWVEVGGGVKVAVGFFALGEGVALGVQVRVAVGGEVAVSLAERERVEEAIGRAAIMSVSTSKKTPVSTRRSKASKILVFIK